jgi:hypothetical protein
MGGRHPDSSFVGLVPASLPDVLSSELHVECCMGGRVEHSWLDQFVLKQRAPALFRARSVLARSIARSGGEESCENTGGICRDRHVTICNQLFMWGIAVGVVTVRSM